MSLNHRKQIKNTIEPITEEENDSLPFSHYWLVNNSNASDLKINELRVFLLRLSDLYAKGEISKKGFITLIEYTCQLFVEREIEDKLSVYLEQKVSNLSDRLFSKNVLINLLDLDETND